MGTLPVPLPASGGSPGDSGDASGSYKEFEDKGAVTGMSRYMYNVHIHVQCICPCIMESNTTNVFTHMLHVY